MVYTYFITGANKGIGLSVVTDLVKKDGVKVIASARSPAKATELQKLAESTKKVEIVELDYSSRASIEKLGPQLEKLAPEGIDFFIGNAGVFTPFKKAIETTYEELTLAFEINYYGNLFTFKEVYPFLLKKETKKVVFTGSVAGSLTGFVGYSQAAYGASKAALNYLILALKTDHGAEGFTFVSINPGLVITDMTKDAMSQFTPEQIKLYNVLTPEQSAAGLVKLYDSITVEDSGKFYNVDGKEYPL